MELTEYILLKNPYLQKGFGNAFMQAGIFAHDGKELLQIFPNDKLGNFFYILGANESTYKYISKAPDLYQDTKIMTLVACVDNANVEQVISNIRSTLLNFGNIDVTSSSWSRELIMIEQLKGLGVDKIQHALQRLKSETIVKIEFKEYSKFIPSNCEIKNPCENGCL